jgi:hypothetical protein
MQNNLTIEILKEGLKVQLKEVEAGLESKARFIKDQYKKDLSPQIVSRMKIEEEHIRAVIGLVEHYNNMIEAYDQELQKERVLSSKNQEIAILFLNDSKDYMDKYYALILKKNENDNRNN